MTKPTEAVSLQAARARWRADLLEFHAAEIDRLVGDDPSPTAEGIRADATRKRAEATVHLDHAEAAERLSIAKQELDADPSNPDLQRKRDLASAAMVELRAYWRGIGEATGNRAGYMKGLLDNFPEPDDDEVTASHGGKN